MKQIIKNSLEEHRALLARLDAECQTEIEAIAQAFKSCLQQGGTIFWCGNGGSASDAEHLCAELVGRFQADRKALSSYALSSNTSTITSIANDFGFEFVFSRQIEGLAKPADVLVCITTSGNSGNILAAANTAKKLGVTVIGLLGNDGGKVLNQCDLSIVIPHNNTARIQEMHITIGHIVCQIVEAGV